MSRVQNIHIGLPSPCQAGVDKGEHSVVRGDYEYWHYCCDQVDDRGWGCGYRTLQTLCSWVRRQHLQQLQQHGVVCQHPSRNVKVSLDSYLGPHPVREDGKRDENDLRNGGGDNTSICVISSGNNTNDLEMNGDPSASSVAGDGDPSASSVAGDGDPSASSVAGDGDPSASSVAGDGDPSASSVAGDGDPSASSVAGDGDPSASSVAGDGNAKRLLTERTGAGKSDSVLCLGQAGLVRPSCQPGEVAEGGEGRGAVSGAQGAAAPSIAGDNGSNPAAPDVPSLRQIEEALVSMGDKPKSFVGSRQWIGSYEVCLCLDYFYNVPCKILHVHQGSDLAKHLPSLYSHFSTLGSPVMMGGECDASSKGIMGVCVSPAALLVVDPHYSGSTDLAGALQSGGWVRWVPLAEFHQSSFYNLCLPQLVAL